jgi:hypothetical protein
MIAQSRSLYTLEVCISSADFISCRTLKKILDARIKIVPGDWATFLYADNSYDPDKPDKGLFHGYFLFRVCFLNTLRHPLLMIT